jgi:hypothetical protein
MKCNFTVGQQVTMIRDHPWVQTNKAGITHINSVGPKFGEVCTISGMLAAKNAEIYICLVEFPTEQGGYWHAAFKPVQSTETGMSILRGLLKTRSRELVS